MTSTGDLPLRTIWAATGNNVVLRGDTVRRVLWLRMDSDEERPEERTGFRFPDLLAHVNRERPRLLAHALTILRAWFVSGSPRGKVRPFGSFEGWAGTIAETLAWLDMGDIIETRIEVATKGDRDKDFLEGIIAALERHAFARVGMTSGQLVRAADKDDDLHDILLEFMGERNAAQRLGKRLQSLKGRVVGGKRLASKTGEGKVSKWFVESTKTPKKGGVEGVRGSAEPSPTIPARNVCAHARGMELVTPSHSPHSLISPDEEDGWEYEREERVAIMEESQF